MFLPLMLAALLVVANDPAPNTATPPSQATIERFIAVLPDADRLEQVDRTADPLELERLTGLNPGRTDAIRPVLEQFAGCAGPVNNRLYVHMLGVVARNLGEEKVGRLIAFYAREDIAALDPVMSRGMGGATLSAAEQAEFDRVMATYPLADLAEQMTAFNPDYFDVALMTEITGCEVARDEAFARIGIRTLSEEDEAAMEAMLAEEEGPGS